MLTVVDLVIWLLSFFLTLISLGILSISNVNVEINDSALKAVLFSLMGPFALVSLLFFVISGTFLSSIENAYNDFTDHHS